MARDAEVSVVVATYQRADLLPALLGGLVAQDDARFEVIVVDDASTDDTAAVLARLAATAPFPVRVLRQEGNQGPSAARNRGWRAATAPVVVFTDDDCVPQPGWLRGLIAGIERGADIVQGRTEPDPAHLQEHGPFGRTMRVPHEEGYYETCNIAYRREWLERLGGFDESFRIAEDVDLAWRAREAGARTAFAADALVYHAVFPSDWWVAARKVDRSGGLQRALRRHPDARRHLHKRVFHRPAHAASLAAAAAGLALLAQPRSPVRWAVAAVLGARYAWLVRMVRYPPPRKAQWFTVVPAAFCFDLYETAVFARASVRERTLLL